MKILINTPDLTKHGGGVTNHYKGLFLYWNYNVKYNTVGSRKSIPGYIILVFDYVKFVFLCVFGNYDIILLNPSLGNTALKRDAVFLRISHFFKIKTFVFFHGWNKDLAVTIDNKPNIFLRRFRKADGFLVLASSFKKQLENWGIKGPIYLTTTKVDNSLIDNFCINKKTFSKNILFLARIEENKGIIIALEAMALINKKYPDIKLIVAGDGKALQIAKDLVHKKSILNVIFVGNLKGGALIEVFSKSDIYILPTTHGEGLPTSVLEAMAFGLPIISRPVGGLVDFFEEDKMGYLIESLEPEAYANSIIDLIKNPEKSQEMSKYNHGYAKKHFMASKVASKIEKILNT